MVDLALRRTATVDDLEPSDELDSLTNADTVDDVGPEAAAAEEVSVAM